MTAPTPYFHFRGEARAALTYYADVFGCGVQLHTFDEFGRTDGPADAVAHGFLVDGPVALFAADVAGDEPAFRSQGHLGVTLIRLAVSRANALGCKRFFAQVQMQNVPLFRKLGWQLLEETGVHGRPHARMQAELSWYPPCHDPVSGFVTRSKVLP